MSYFMFGFGCGVIVVLFVTLLNGWNRKKDLTHHISVAFMNAYLSGLLANPRSSMSDLKHDQIIKTSILFAEKFRDSLLDKLK